MKYLFTLLSVLIFCSAKAQHGKIHGILVDTVENTPVVNCPVILIDSLNNHLMVFTNDNGEFEIDSLAPGVYSLKTGGLFERDSLIENVQLDSSYSIFFKIKYPPYCQYNKKNNSCPFCGKTDKVIPIIYGFPMENLIERSEKGEVILGGCVISGCDPHWHCTRDNKSF